ncbi:uncharacterized protein KY384_008793 [Bacidia gigantensis]|uniref:uncharacterized protein n=1 Tax=Bacidia gigantensis TaxID=2732470 RepID=UPI001D055998|nr:uncharacterized protein KY384_008793 [Bacidia gigantensis]KAG8526592.1 hypothetical protein KY384_008793 [Bacidia gigantensis]
MRLINCRTLLLEEFVDHRQVEYAILSHTWEENEEVLYNDFSGDLAKSKEKKGWRKIEQVCRLAQDDGLNFAWIDTCCIDKSSSAELSEAINSMFVWYRDAKVCYAYLADHDSLDHSAQMKDSRWFKRGWTLQELIAPTSVRFYDRDWNLIGTKADLYRDLEGITGIGQEILHQPNHNLEQMLESMPIAKRMSWASNRVTTRIEDTAYCLLGIFGINLALLYGEGARAYTRLQEEIVRNTNDLSILGWQAEGTTDQPSVRGCFAGHPFEFRESSDVEHINELRFAPDFALTNKGLKLHTLLHYDQKSHLCFLELNCFESKHSNMRLAIYLQHQGAGVYVRALPDSVAKWNERVLRNNAIDKYAENKQFFFTKSLDPGLIRSSPGLHGHDFLINEFNSAFTNEERAPQNLCDTATGLWITQGLHDFVGGQLTIFKRDPLKFKKFWLLFGFGYGYEPWVSVSPASELLSMRIKACNWRQLADYAYLPSPCRTLKVSFASGKKHYVHAGLKKIVYYGEEIHEIEMRLSVDKTFPQDLQTNGSNTD